jgi:hypothetical protein
MLENPGFVEKFIMIDMAPVNYAELMPEYAANLTDNLIKLKNYDLKGKTRK